MSIKLDFDKLWAEHIYKKRFENKDYIFAYVRKFHSYDDVVMEGEGKWIGVEEKKIPRMVIDIDENSPTHGERIPKVNEVEYQDGHKEQIPEILGTRYGYTFEDNPNNIVKFKKLQRDTIHGSTKFVWCLTSKNISCKYPDDFWKSAIKDVEDIQNRSQSIYVQTVPSKSK